MASIVIVTVACQPASYREVAPHTGDELFERQTTNTRAEDLKKNESIYVNPERLRCRLNPDQPPQPSQPPHPANPSDNTAAPQEQQPCVLEQGDKLRVVDSTPKGKDGFIEVVIVETRQPNPPKGSIFVPPQYLKTEPIEITTEQRDANRYFMIQNIATEKLRVYERCDTQGQPRGQSQGQKQKSPCAHKLVLETDMVAGEHTPDGKRQTILGSFRISKWFKFYEDINGHYLSWYHPDYPPLPPPGADFAAWTSKSLLPPGGGSGRGRGKFGWYTAHLEPNAAAQWTHGTIGWGADGDRFIDLTRDPALNSVTDPRSAGCSRVENQAIAFIRELLPVGTKVIKVYAKEGYGDPKLERYSTDRLAKWDWILTKEGVNTDGPKAGRIGALARGVSRDSVLEVGTFHLDQIPDVVPLRNGNSKTGLTGNLYEVDPADFRGYLAVDEGRLVNYTHPKNLEVGGVSDGVLPSFSVSTSTDVNSPHHPGARTKSETLHSPPVTGTNLPDGTVVNE